MIKKEDFIKIFRMLEHVGVKSSEPIIKSWYEAFKNCDERTLKVAIQKLVIDWNDPKHPPLVGNLKEYYDYEIETQYYHSPPPTLEYKSKKVCPYCNNCGARIVEMVLATKAIGGRIIKYYEVHKKPGVYDHDKYYTSFAFRCDCEAGERFWKALPKWNDYFNEDGYLKRIIYF